MMLGTSRQYQVLVYHVRVVTIEGTCAPSLLEARDRTEIVPVEMVIRQRSQPIYHAAGSIQPSTFEHCRATTR